MKYFYLNLTDEESVLVSQFKIAVTESEAEAESIEDDDSIDASYSIEEVFEKGLPISLEDEVKRNIKWRLVNG